MVRLVNYNTCIYGILYVICARGALTSRICWNYVSSLGSGHPQSTFTSHATPRSTVLHGSAPARQTLVHAALVTCQKDWPPRRSPCQGFGSESGGSLQTGFRGRRGSHRRGCQACSATASPRCPTGRPPARPLGCGAGGAPAALLPRRRCFVAPAKLKSKIFSVVNNIPISILISGRTFFQRKCFRT